MNGNDDGIRLGARGGDLGPGLGDFLGPGSGHELVYELLLGRERFEQATQKIYGEPVSSWDGEWTTVLMSGVEPATKELVRKELSWIGFGSLSPNVLAHPAPDMAGLDLALERLGLAHDLVVMTGRTVRNEPGMRALVQDSWNLGDIDQRYASFVERFRPLIKAHGKDANVAPKSAFLVRTLLIQEYRKALLRDPLLPVELLPRDWHGTAAYQLCRNLYRAVYAPADRYLEENMETADGPLPPPSRAYWQRFGGLEETRKVNYG